MKEAVAAPGARQHGSSRGKGWWENGSSRRRGHLLLNCHQGRHDPLVFEGMIKVIMRHFHINLGVQRLPTYYTAAILGWWEEGYLKPAVPTATSWVDYQGMQSELRISQITAHSLSHCGAVARQSD